MAQTITMPKLGSTMVSGTVAKWLKKEGEAVKQGEAVVEVETDKITNEVLSPVDGYVLKILAAEGDELDIMAPMAVIGNLGESIG